MKKTENIRLRLTKKAKETLQKQAQSEGLTLTKYILKKCFSIDLFESLESETTEKEAKNELKKSFLEKMVSAKLSLNDIATVLNARGFKTKIGKDYTRNTVATLLRSFGLQSDNENDKQGTQISE